MYEHEHDDINEPRTEREVMEWVMEVDTLAYLCEREVRQLRTRNPLREEWVA